MRIRVLIILLLALVLIFSGALAYGKANQNSFYLIPVKSRNEINKFEELNIPIRQRTSKGVVVFINSEDFKKLQSSGFKLERLAKDPALPDDFGLKSDSFHDNEDVDTIFANLTSNYPSICERFTVGYSVENRPILGLKISGDSSRIDNKVEVRVAGAIHGNEIMSVEIPLLMAQYLAENYKTDNTVTTLLDEIVFYIIPLVNPDGRAANDRENANYVDLNRNFGYQYNPNSSNGDVRKSGMFSQPETYAIAKHHLQRNFSLSFIFHTTASYVNYFWNFASRETPDESLVDELATRYGNLSGYTPTQGYDWYQTYGDLNDFSYGSKGGFDYTIETANNDITATWNKNRDALLDAFEQARRGLHGVVTDADSGEPIEAMILCDDPFWPVYSDAEHGDYHRILSSGTYSCTYISPGYEASKIENMVIDGNNPTTQDVALYKNDKYYGFLVPATSTRYTNITYSPAALGPPDGVSYSLTEYGSVVIDMAIEMSGYNNTLAVYEGSPYENEEYKVYVGNDFIGPWIYLGYATGDSQFDLSGLGDDKARYVRIVDNGTESSSPNIGFDLDAVEYIVNSPVDGDSDLEPDIDSDESCTKPFDCLDLFITRENDCAEANIKSHVEWSEGCTMTIKLLPFCGEGDSQYLSLSPDENGYSGTQNCSLRQVDGSLWQMNGECGFYYNIFANVNAVECESLSTGSQLISSNCEEPCNEDGDFDLDRETDDFEDENQIEADHDKTDVDKDLTEKESDNEVSEEDGDNLDEDLTDYQEQDNIDYTEDTNEDDTSDDEIFGSGSSCNSVSSDSASAILMLLMLMPMLILRSRRQYKCL